MSKLTDGERLVKLETQLTQVLLGISELKIDGKDFRDRLDLLLPTFATHEDLNTVESKLTKQINQSRNSRLKDLIIQALLIGPISALIGFFFANINK